MRKIAAEITKIVILSVTLGAALQSCQQNGSEIARLVEERDSLRKEVQVSRLQQANLTDLIDVVENGLDSISVQEGAIFVTHGEGKVSKEEALKRVDFIKDLINTQKSKISQLEKKIKEQQSEIGRADEETEKLVSYFKQQLEAKDREIADLKEQIKNMNSDISNLNQQINRYRVQIAALDEDQTRKKEALDRQDRMLNRGYVMIAPKKLLESKGIVKKGKLVAQSALDRTKFKAVDVRNYNMIEFQGKKPKVLTQMPEGSYRITTSDKKNFTLEITNPAQFWQISNYLVIQSE